MTAHFATRLAGGMSECLPEADVELERFVDPVTRAATGAVKGDFTNLRITADLDLRTILATDGDVQVTDSDSGPNADPANRGRDSTRNRIRGCTEGHQGSNADPAGNGRGNRLTDSDSGANSDPARCRRRR